MTLNKEHTIEIMKAFRDTTKMCCMLSGERPEKTPEKESYFGDIDSILFMLLTGNVIECVGKERSEDDDIIDDDYYDIIQEITFSENPIEDLYEKYVSYIEEKRSE